MKPQAVTWFWVLVSFAFPQRGYGATDVVAFCKKASTLNLKVACLKAEKGATFTEDVLKVCLDLGNESAAVRCLQIVRNDAIAVDLLKECDESPTDWEILDCLKQVSGKDPKTFSEGEFAGVFLPQDETAYIQNREAPSDAVSITSMMLKYKGSSTCLRYRAAVPLRKDWMEEECWSTDRRVFNVPPVKVPGDFPLGYKRYNHCSIRYQCATQ